MTKDNNNLVRILEDFWPRNKAKGLLAQTVFLQEIRDGIFGEGAHKKFLPGCWLLAPKSSDFYKFRFCFFIHSQIIPISDIGSFTAEKLLGDYYRPFHAIAEFMNNAGIGVVYAVPLTEDGFLPIAELKIRNFQNIKWQFYKFANSEFILENAAEFFEKWEGTRGRPSYGGNWDPEIKKKIQQLSSKVLTDLLLNELFYTGFLKGTLKKPLNDPYDVDSFLTSISQSFILPMEIKEKFPGQSGRDQFFGIDAGRVMMLLRLCVPNDANAIYLIRELDEQGRFIKWKYITLSDIIMTSSWNLQAGGIGMGGQSTQTIRLPYSLFREFNDQEISEESLRKIGNLPKDVKGIARYFGDSIKRRFQV